MADEFLGRKAPHFALPDVEGQRHSLDDYGGRWLLVVFLRHLACLLCREHLSQIAERQAEWERRRVRILTVTFEPADRAKRFLADSQSEYPLLLDTERHIYAAYGMGSASIWRLAQPSTWWNYLRLFMGGWAPRLPDFTDYQQLGGDVLIDPEGTIRFFHASEDPADRPRLEDIFSALDRTEAQRVVAI